MPVEQVAGTRHRRAVEWCERTASCSSFLTRGVSTVGVGWCSFTCLAEFLLKFDPKSQSCQGGGQKKQNKTKTKHDTMTPDISSFVLRTHFRVAQTPLPRNPLWKWPVSRWHILMSHRKGRGLFMSSWEWCISLFWIVSQLLLISDFDEWCQTVSPFILCLSQPEWLTQLSSTCGVKENQLAFLNKSICFICLTNKLH